MHYSNKKNEQISTHNCKKKMKIHEILCIKTQEDNNAINNYKNRRSTCLKVFADGMNLHPDGIVKIEKFVGVNSLFLFFFFFFYCPFFRFFVFIPNMNRNRRGC